MTPEEIKKILENHIHWLDEDCDGWKNMRANLRGADLYGANLYGANLRRADLYGADLRGADFYGADLRGANFYGADLRGADLRGADLCRANLRRANLYGANLRRADLCGADLCGANLYGADLRGAKNIPFIPIECPNSGSFIGWKKCNGLIVKLLIPEDALRSSATTRKCRCDKANVLEIQTLNGEPATINHVSSNYDSAFIYTVGETVSVDDFDTDRWNECAPGIHFFINRQEAVNY